MDKIKQIFGIKSNPPPGTLTFKEMEIATSRRMHTIVEEFSRTFKFLRKYPRSVTIFGSTRLNENSPYYDKSRRLAQRIARELKYAVTTGGGPGIMEAANRGAHEVGGDSIGMNIKLPLEQSLNKYTTAHIKFYYFFIRKVALSYSSETYIFFPGGFGTLDEFFEIITLIQTKKIPRVPVVLFGSEYWGKLDEFITLYLVNKFGTISPEDRKIYKITDDDNEVLDIIRRAPLRRE